MKIHTTWLGIDFSSNDFKALVYELMETGSLDEWLHPVASENKLHPVALENKALKALNLLERVNIAVDVAYALDYLQHHCQTTIVHCDLKLGNVRLDGELTAHVGDFGLARFLPDATHKLPTDQTNSIRVKGSFDYIAPSKFAHMSSIVFTPFSYICLVKLF